MPRKMPTILVLICLAITGLPKLNADDGSPIAIRRWSDTGFTIETMGNMHVGSGLTEADTKRLPRPVDFQVSDLAPKGHALIRWSVETSSVVTYPNIERDEEYVEHDITVHRGAWQTTGAPVFSVDGGGLLIDLNAIASSEIEGLVRHDNPEHSQAWLTVIATSAQFDTDQLKKIRDKLNPQVMIVGSSVDKIGDQKVEAISHNTIAVFAPAKFDRKAATRFISLGDQPWAMTDEVAGLFDKKEAACKSSREMFAKLSVNQMNFKPDNGSHTPRWNSEHMMGRELLFFSQIFHAVDPSIPVMDLNPRQMPKDYTFAHADWSGAEEAAQMMRVEAFTRRFAYLLDGMDLDKKAAGSKFWKPRGLLEQMERHYKQHSANVVKKMDLDGWPSK